MSHLVMAATEALQPQLDAHLQWAIRAKSLREKLGGNLALPDLVSYIPFLLVVDKIDP